MKIKKFLQQREDNSESKSQKGKIMKNALIGGMEKINRKLRILRPKNKYINKK